MEQIQMKIAELETAILNAHPTLPILLREIHTVLKNDPDTVTLLSPEEIATVVAGLKRQTQVEITNATMKKKTTSLKNVSLADL